MFPYLFESHRSLQIKSDGCELSAVISGYTRAFSHYDFKPDTQKNPKTSDTFLRKN